MNDMVFMEVWTKTVDGKLCYVYQGMCDCFLTRWITQTEWDLQLTVRVSDGILLYNDSKGKEILVYEEDDAEWNLYD